MDELAARGFTVEESGPDWAVMTSTGSKPNHVLHAILSLLTAGLWLIVWLFIALNAGKTVRVLLRLDLNGNVQRSLPPNRGTV